MFRRFHRDRLKDTFRQPGRSSKDPYDPAAKLDEANGVDDIRLANLPDDRELWDLQSGELHTMADGTRNQFGKLKEKEPAPPDNDHTRRELARYAEYLRSTGVVVPKALTAEERFKAEYEAANDGDWSVNTEKPVNPEEPCPTCEAPYAVDPSGYCLNCHDQILRAKDLRYD
jgi:hypothetical protein